MVNCDWAFTSAEGVVRHDLLQQLAAAHHLPITVLSAPAGAGKSTLLAQWRRLNAAQSIAYLPLQGRDNETHRFFLRLIDEVRSAYPTFDTAWYDPLQAPALWAGEALADSLSKLGGKLYIVIDDFQVIDCPSILGVLRGVFTRPPNNVHWIIASRNQPEIGLASLRLAGRMHTLTQENLRLDAGLVRQLNAYLGGHQLSDEYIASLLAMTEGWLGGVKVALLAYARYGVLALERFDGSQPDIVEYFGHVVLRHLTRDVREFFLCSSIFERFNGEACDEVLQRTNTALLLEQLSAQQLFILPAGSGWFRYHGLLQDFLARRLQLEYPERIADLHQRACEYFIARNDFDLAVVHAHKSGRRALLYVALQQAGEQWLAQGRFNEIIKALEVLDELELEQQPLLCRLLVAALSLSRRFHQARYHMEAASLDEASRSFLAQQLLLFQEERLDNPGLLLQRFTDSTRPLQERALALSMLAYRDLIAGRLKLALTQAAEAKVLLRQSGQNFLESYADLIIALAERHSGRSIAARKTVSIDYQRTDRHEPAWTNRATAMVVALYEQNQLSQAQQLSEELITRLSASSATEAIATVHIILARLLHRKHQGAAAGRLLERLGCILNLGSHSRGDAQLIQEEMRQAYLDGRHAALDSLAQRYSLGQRLEWGEWSKVRDYDEAWERLGLSCVYWLCSRGAHQRAKRLLRVLVQALRRSEMRSRALVAEGLLLAINAAEQPRHVQLAELRQLVEDYGIVNIGRSVFDEAPGFASQVLGLISTGHLAIPARYREAYAEFLPEQQDEVIECALQPERLTDKEAEIVECLVAGLSNQQISDRTGIALSTTKWHLKNIYAKLDVSSRTQVILKMRSSAIH